MAAMTTHERMTRMYRHREADRVPITDSPWGTTLDRWRREGMPADASFEDFFGLDRFVSIGVDNSPRYPWTVIEETPEYTITKSQFGVTMKNWRKHGGVPEFLDFTVTDAKSWLEAKKRMTPDRDRVDWDRLKREYRGWRGAGAWITGEFWFGFDVTHSFFVGTERVLEGLAEEAEWLPDIFNTMLDLDIALMDQVWEAGYTFDAINWYDDMGYKGHPFFSLRTYRNMVKPAHKLACDWAKAKGVRVHLHSCGDVRTLIPDLIEIGVDMLNPCEVKAGMDPAWLKKTYGDRLAFHGGVNAALFDKPDLLWAQMREAVPVLKQRGGYLLSSDHSVPDSVSLPTFTEFVRLGKELGTY
jgi:uroporphyrinogen decarboxylase